MEMFRELTQKEAEEFRSWARENFNPETDSISAVWHPEVRAECEKMKKELKFNKKVELNLVGLDGNTFYLMGAFIKQARKEDWTEKEIDIVINECKSGDYDHLLQTLINHTK